MNVSGRAAADPAAVLRRRRIVRLILILIAVIPAVGYARAYMTMFDLPGNIDPFTDANTYLAAGERLNAGHDLYALQPGDRPVLIIPGSFSAPLVSPPTVAVLWRPIAALPFGFTAWLVAVWIVLLGTVVYIVAGCGIPAVLLCLVLAEPIGNQLAVGNVTAFFPALLIVAWNYRSRPWISAVVALMTAIKIAPGTLFGWSAISRRPRWILWAICSFLLLEAVTAIGAGPGSFAEYLGVAGGTQPSPLSLAGLTGITWLSYAVLIVGTLLAAAIRDVAMSFVIAVIALVAGTPALYLPGLVPLLAITAPLIERQRTNQPLFGNRLRTTWQPSRRHVPSSP